MRAAASPCHPSQASRATPQLTRLTHALALVLAAPAALRIARAPHRPPPLAHAALGCLVIFNTIPQMPKWVKEQHKAVRVSLAKQAHTEEIEKMSYSPRASPRSSGRAEGAGKGPDAKGGQSPRQRKGVNVLTRLKKPRMAS